MNVEMRRGGAERVTPAARHRAATAQAALTEWHASPGLGPVWEDATITLTARGGSTTRHAGGRAVGLTIPPGQTGTSAFIQPRLALSGAEVAALAGRRLRWTLDLRTSAGFARRLRLSGQVQTACGTQTRAPTLLRNSQTTPQRRVIEFDWTVTGDELDFRPLVQIVDTTPTPAEAWFELTDMHVAVSASPSDTLSLAAENLHAAHRRTREAARRGAGLLLGQEYEVVRTVRADGTGDHRTIGEALAAITDAGPSRRHLIKVGPGRYDEFDLATKSWVDIEGCGPRLTWLRGYQPPDTAPGLVQSRSTMDLNSHSKLRGMRITAQNLRYALHPDQPAGNVDQVLVIEDCELEHFGNQEVLDHQLSIGASPGLVWQAVRPLGSGTASGQRMILRNCTLYARGIAPFLVHTNGDFARPSLVRLEHCRLVDRAAAGTALWIQPLGSGQSDRVEIIGCVGNGALAYQAYRNASPLLSSQRADRAEVAVVGHGNRGMPYRYVDSKSRALRIESACAGAGSAVEIGGTAASLLFGGVVQDVAGGGVAAAAYGTVDVGSGTAGTSLGARLGDRTTSPVTLTVALDGGPPREILFDADHTAQLNSAILARINTLLGGSATASLMDVTALYRPCFADQEEILLNTAMTAIRRRRAVARGDDGHARPMTSADPPHRFIGIALETIPPGHAGRVLARGPARAETDLDRADDASFAHGDRFGLAEDGRWTLDATTPLLTAINPTDVHWPT